MDPGNQGLKLRDKKNTNRSNLGMKKLLTAFLYTCGEIEQVCEIVRIWNNPSMKLWIQ